MFIRSIARKTLSLLCALALLLSPLAAIAEEARGGGAVFGFAFRSKDEHSPFEYADMGRYIEVNISGEYSGEGAPRVRAAAIDGVDGFEVLESWTVDGIGAEASLTLGATVVALPEGASLALFAVYGDALGEMLEGDLALNSTGSVALDAGLTGIAAVGIEDSAEKTPETVEPDGEAASEEMEATLVGESETEETEETTVGEAETMEAEEPSAVEEPVGEAADEAAIEGAEEGSAEQATGEESEREETAAGEPADEATEEAPEEASSGEAPAEEEEASATEKAGDEDAADAASEREPEKETRTEASDEEAPEAEASEESSEAGDEAEEPVSNDSAETQADESEEDQADAEPEKASSDQQSEEAQESDEQAPREETDETQASEAQEETDETQASEAREETDETQASEAREETDEAEQADGQEAQAEADAEGKEDAGQIAWSWAERPDCSVTVTAPSASGIPEDAVLSVRELGADFDGYENILSETEAALGAPLAEARVLDIRLMAEEAVCQPAEDTRVSVAIVLVDRESWTDADAEVLCPGTEAPDFEARDGEQGIAFIFETDTLGLFAVARPEKTPEEEEEEPDAGEAVVRVWRDDSVEITALYTAEAEIPENAELIGTRITAQDDPERYASRMSEAGFDTEAEAALAGLAVSEDPEDDDDELEGERAEYEPLLYNIGFFVDGVEVEPKAPVTINVRFLGAEYEDATEATLYHFTDDGVDVVEGEDITGEDEAFTGSFQMDSFSDVVLAPAKPARGKQDGTISAAYIDACVDGELKVPDVVFEPSAEEKAAVEECIPGVENDYERDGTKDLIWKTARYDAENNQAVVELSYFQKRYGSKLDFIFLLDESGTMGHYVSVDGYRHTRAQWARYIAVKAAKGIFEGNKPGVNGFDNRVMLIPWSTWPDPSPFFDNYNSVIDWVNAHSKYDYGCTYHGRAVRAATEAAEASYAAGRTPVVIYMSDYACHAIIHTKHEYYFQKPDVDRLNEIALVYPVLVYPSSRVHSPERMLNLNPDPSFRRFMGDDPSGLLAIFQDIIEDAISYVDPRTTMVDELSPALKNAMTSGDDPAVWRMVNENGGRLRNGQLYTREFSYPLDDQKVVSGSMPTNDSVTLTAPNAFNGSGELAEQNRIDESPKLDKAVVFNLLLMDFTGEYTDIPLQNASFELYEGEGTDSARKLLTKVTDAKGQFAILPQECPFDRGSRYTLKQVSTVDSMASLPTGTWLLEVDDNYVVTATTVENETTKNMTVSRSAFQIWNVGLEDATVPLVPVVVRKSWGDMGGINPTSVRFTVLGVDKDTGNTYPLTAYNGSDRRAQGFAEVTELTAADRDLDGIAWSRQVYVPAYKEGVTFFDTDGKVNDYVTLSDGSHAYRLREDGIEPEVSAENGRWEVASAEAGVRRIKGESYVVLVNPETTSTVYDIGSYSNDNPGDATYYRFELILDKQVISDKKLEEKIKKVTSLTFEFEFKDASDANKTKKAILNLDFLELNEIDKDYFHVVHVAIPKKWGNFSGGSTVSGSSIKSDVVPLRLVLHTSSGDFVAYDPSAGINYMKMSGTRPYLGFLSGYDAYYHNPTHRMRIKELLKKVEYEETITEKLDDLNCPVLTLTNDFQRRYSVTVGSEWTDGTVDAASTGGITSVTYDIDGAQVTVPVGQTRTVAVSRGNHSVRQLSYRLKNGAVVNADDAGRFDAYAVSVPVISVSPDIGHQHSEAIFQNTRKLVPVTMQTTFEPESAQLENVAFPVMLYYGAESTRLTTTAAQGAQTVSDAIPLYGVNGVLTGAIARRGDAIAGIDSDDALTDAEKAALKAALENYDTEIDIQQIQDPANGEVNALDIRIRNVLAGAPVMITKRWVNDTVADTSNRAQANGTQSVTVRLYRVGEDQPVVPYDSESGSPDIVLTPDGDWTEIVYVPILSEYEAREVKIGDMAADQDRYAVSVRYPAGAGRVNISEEPLTRSGAAVVIVNTWIGERRLEAHALQKAPNANHDWLSDVLTDHDADWRADDHWLTVRDNPVAYGEYEYKALLKSPYSSQNMLAYVYCEVWDGDATRKLKLDSSVKLLSTKRGVMAVQDDGAEYALASNDVYFVYFENPRIVPLYYVERASEGETDITVRPLEADMARWYDLSVPGQDIKSTFEDYSYGWVYRDENPDHQGWVPLTLPEENGRYRVGAYAIGPDVGIVDTDAGTDDFGVLDGVTIPKSKVFDSAAGIALHNVADGIEYAAAVEGRSQAQTYANGRTETGVALYVIYEKTTAPVTITKTVTGGMGDRNRDFTFTLTVEGATEGDRYGWTKTDATGAVTQDGDAGQSKLSSGGSFTLKHGERIAIDLPMDRAITVVETNAGSYKKTFELGGNARAVEGEAVENGVRFTVTGSAASLNVTNDLPAVSPTGVDLRYAPYALMLLAGIALLALARRRRNRDK